MTAHLKMMKISQHKLLCASLVAALIINTVHAAGGPNVRLTETNWHGVGCYQIEMPMGTVYFEKDNGVSGWRKHIPKGDFKDFTPEWIYVGDPKATNYLFVGKTPDDNAPNENRRQVRSGTINMDLYSCGRGKIENNGMSGNDHICVIGFINASRSHDEIKNFITGILAHPFEATRK